MNKFGKVIALALAATMVFGSSLTAFAGDNDGGSTGTGAPEGHVEKKATNVVLPTIAAEATPFAYIMDPEGLIVETAGAKYQDTVFPTKENDTRVYFNNGTNDAGKTVYLNSSIAQTVVNKSSFDIDLTVKAAVTDEKDTDIPLVAQNALATATEASLYLGLAVGEGSSADKKAITTAAAAEKTVTIAGSPDNFKIAVNSAGTDYEYRELTLDEYKATEGHSAATEIPWESESFNLEGQVTTGKDITATTTAPKIAVTWSWVDPNAEPEVVDEAPSIAVTEYTAAADTPIEIAVDLGSGAEAAEGIASVTYQTKSGDTKAVAEGTGYSFADGKVTFTAETVNAFVNSSNTSRVYTITFDDDAATAVAITLSK